MDKEILRLLTNIQKTAELVKNNDLQSLERMGQAMLDIYGNLIGHFAEVQEQYNLLAVVLAEKEEKTTDATKKAKASKEHKGMVKLEQYIDLTKRQHDYIKKLLDAKRSEYMRNN